MAKELKRYLIRKQYVLDAGLEAKEDSSIIVPFSNMNIDRTQNENAPYTIPTEEKVKNLIKSSGGGSGDPLKEFTGGQGQATDTAISREIKDSAGNQIVLASDGTDATVAVGDATFSHLTEIAKDSVAIIDKTSNSQGVKFTNTDLIYTDNQGTNTQKDWPAVLAGSAPSLANIYPLIKSMLIAGTNISLTPNDVGFTITINSTGGSGGTSIKIFPDTAGWSDIYSWANGNIGDLFIATPNGTQPECLGQVIKKNADNSIVLDFTGGDQFQQITLAASSGNAPTKGPIRTVANSQANHYPITKQVLVAGTGITFTDNDAANTRTINSTGGSGGLKTFTATDTQSTVFAAVNVGDRVRFTQDNTVVNVYDSSSQGAVFAKDANSATFILQKEGIGYDLMIATISNGGTGTITATPTNFKIQDLEIEDSNGEYIPRIDKIKAYVDAKGSGDGAPWILYTGAQYIQQVNDANLQAQKIFEIPIDMTGNKKYISAGYEVQAQLIDNNAATGPIKLTSSKWTTTFNAYIDATLPEISNQVKVEYSGNGSLAVRTWYFIDKITNPQQWTFNTYMAVSNFTTDHFDWFEFFGGVGAPNTVGLERSHIQVPPSPDDRRNFQAYTTPPRFGINPDWTEFKDTPSINANYNAIVELKDTANTVSETFVKIDATNTYEPLYDVSAGSSSNPLLTLEGAVALQGKWVEKEVTNYDIPDADTGKLCRLTFIERGGSNLSYTYGQLGTKSFVGNAMRTMSLTQLDTERMFVSVSPSGNWQANDTIYFQILESFFVPAKPQRTNSHNADTGDRGGRQIQAIEVWE